MKHKNIHCFTFLYTFRSDAAHMEINLVCSSYTVYNPRHYVLPYLHINIDISHSFMMMRTTITGIIYMTYIDDEIRIFNFKINFKAFLEDDVGG